MATITDTAAVAEAVKQRFGAAFQNVEEGIGQGRRVFAKGRETVEDGVAAAALHVRRHPLRTVAFVAGAGAIVGCAVGFVLGRTPWSRR